MKMLMRWVMVLAGLSATAQTPLPSEQPVRDVVVVSGTNATTWTCLHESFELRSLEIVNGAGAGVASTSTFSSVTGVSAGSQTNRIGLPNVAAAGTANTANHAGLYLTTNAVPVTFFYGDTITQRYVAPSGSNGLFVLTGRAGPKK